MLQITQKSEISISFFAGDRWVISGKDKKVVTSQSTQDEVQDFLSKNGMVLGFVRESFKNVITLVDLSSIPVEHKTNDGDLLFTDRGNLLTFDRIKVTDHEIRLTLVHAENKYGKKLTLTGDDPNFVARMARLADDMGLTILNPEMQPVIAAHRASLAQQSPSFAPPMTIKKRRLWQRIRNFLGVMAKK